MILGCGDSVPTTKTDAGIDSQVVVDAGCYGPAGTFKMTFELQKSTCDEKYTEGKKFTESLTFKNLKCEKREVVKWDYQKDAFYKCLSTLLVFADRYEGQWVCVLYHDMDHPFCGFSYKITMGK